MKKKYVFLGDLDSINIELVSKSHNFLKNKVKYILIGNKIELLNYLEKIKSNLKINLLIDPFDFSACNKNYLNLFNIDNIGKSNFENIINQIKFSNFLSNRTKIDLVTLPINKYSIKKKMDFTGMTEHLGKLNKKKTIMLMHGEVFSIIPFTTHINPKNIHKYIKANILNSFFKNLLYQLDRKIYRLNFKTIKFLCYNPHCGEDELLGSEDGLIKKTISKFKVITGPYSADSAFIKNNSKTLFISSYHDQALIPFKILNKKSFNLTLGLEYRRLSPAHGTATDIKFKDKSNNDSYLECMLF